MKGDCERSTSRGTKFEPLNQRCGGRRFDSNKGGEMAVREWLRLQNPDFYGGGIFELVPKWDKCTSVLEDCVETW